MQTHKELLLSLREGFEQLDAFDSTGVNALGRRGEMIIRRVFGEDSQYIEQFRDLSFRRSMPLPAIGSSGASPEIVSARQRYWLSGQKESISFIDTMLEDLELSEPEQIQNREDLPAQKSDRVFIVHGHDEGMRESVARVLTKLSLEPVILHEQPDQGRTIIEKFYDYSDVGFAVVLLSPDDRGYLDSDGPDAASSRARQNVILEWGFFLG